MPMFYIQIFANLILYITGVLGIMFNRFNILITLMCIELIFLSTNLNFILFSVYLDDFSGQIFSLLVLTVVAGESAIGLAILIVYYRLKGNILINELVVLKG
jgi:NADH-quinone oxidoreductase subunit K